MGLPAPSGVMASWDGEDAVAEARRIFEEAGRIARLRANLAHVEAARALRDVGQQLERSRLQLVASLTQAIDTAALAVEIRDPYTATHQHRVAMLAGAIATELGWPPARIKGLRLGAAIHDIGKIYIPVEILARPGKLLPAEFELLKAHAQIGYEIVEGIQFPWPIAQMIVQHHERIDGSGYPHGLAGDAVIPEARILAVADVVEAMASDRPYRAALGLDAALQEARRYRGIRFDEAAVDACLRVCGKPGFRLGGQ